MKKRGIQRRSRRSRTGGRARRVAGKAPSVGAGPFEIREIESLRGELERVVRASQPPRWNAHPEDVRRSVIKLVLTLVELIRQLLERQAIRRLDARTLSDEQTEAIGLALMRLEDTIREIAVQFDLDPQDLNLDLGPVGRLL
ncbi:MAG TPA: gas vesicle protein K [Vicinamibacterales bacterium]|nr:gas vesicle protein K [Vicinamibacterales bacterium]